MKKKEKHAEYFTIANESGTVEVAGEIYTFINVPIYSPSPSHQ